MDIDDLHQTLREFICIFLHSVLYVAEIYPQSTFEARRYYDTACWQNAHPGVCEWCEQTSTLCYNTIKEKKCRSLSFVVVNKGVPQERFILDISHLSRGLKAEFHPRNLSQQFRATILSLYQLKLVNPTENDRTITVVFTSDEALSMPEQESPWIVGERQNGAPPTQNVRPIRFIEAASLSFGVYYVARMQ